MIITCADVTLIVVASFRSLSVNRVTQAARG